MADPIDVTGGLQPVSFNVETNKTTDVTVSNATISILEMEDVLFHHDSAVMMPGKPVGASSGDGTEDDATNPDDQATQKKQEQVSGIDALALVFKESEFKPEQCLMVAGHTDTSGGFELNYTLSELRAKNVLYLVLGKDPLDKSDPPQEQGTAWAKISTQRHKIEDYQQILTHFVARGDLPATCDPAGVTNKWDAATESACNAFFDAKITDVAKAAQIKQQVKADSQHKWPEDAWVEVYRLYVSQLQKTLNVTAEQLRVKRETLVTKFNPDHLFVACGESYPIENSQAENYRSQKNRRVEILFLEEKAFENIKCPAAKNRKHKTRLDKPPIECPIWHNFIKREYVDPNDLYAEMYHLQFLYFDRFTRALEIVPEGLTVYAFIEDKKGLRQLDCTTSFKNNVYKVKVQFKEAVEPSGIKDFYFELKTDSMWVYRDKGSGNAVIKKVIQKDYDALTGEEKWRHHDLPKVWASQKFWTRQGSVDAVRKGNDKGDEFINVVKTTRSIRPFGPNVTAEGDPLVFCLEDIVLANRMFNPIPAANGDAAFFDYDYKMIQKNAKGSKSYFSSGGIKDVRIPFKGVFIRCILYERILYVVFQDRVETGVYRGHRAAMFMRTGRCDLVTEFQQIHHRGGLIGNFDSYILREVDYSGGEVLSFIFNYFRYKFADATGATPSSIDQTWIDTTIDNICTEWNDSKAGGSVSLVSSGLPDSNRVRIIFHIEQVSEPFQHKIIKVWPAGKKGRSFMGWDKGEMRSDQNERQKPPDATIFVGAHEFGHGHSLDDDYLERWSNCCYTRDGFVDFKLGSPFTVDVYSMMCYNYFVRPRHYWHYAEWMRKQFVPGKKVAFSVDQKSSGGYLYTIQENSSDKWKPSDKMSLAENYYNVPVTFRIKQQSAAAGADKRNFFDLYLYQLGQDFYSQVSICPVSGKSFKATAILVVKVNLYIDFWWSATYKRMREVLEKMNNSIILNLINKYAVCVNGTAPFERTMVQIQPRYLVADYSRHYKEIDPDLDSKSKYEARRDAILNNPETGLHFKVSVTNPLIGGSSSWNSGDNRHLELYVDDADSFWKYFCQMLGTAMGTPFNKSNFDVSFIVPGGSMNDV